MRFDNVDAKRIGYYSWIVAGHAALAYLLFEHMWGLLLISFIVHYIVSQVGISLTFHRALTHRSVVLPRWLYVIGCVVGGFAMQGSPLTWVAVHRAHHKFSGTDKDPHSPAHLGSLYVHTFGYVFSKTTPKLAIDMFSSWQLLFHKHYYKIYGFVLIGSLFVLPLNVALALFWVPIAFTFQIENLVNTWLHSWDSDRPKNDLRAFPLLLGDAYHKNHHDAPSAARYGKYDPLGIMIERFLK